jgi:hypothetical protein
MFAKYSKVDAKRLLASSAILADSVADSRVDDDPIADHEVCFRILADRVDCAGRIRSQNPWRTESRARQPFHHEKVEVVESRSSHADAHMSRTNIGDRQVGAVLDPVESAMRRDGECSQRNLERYIQNSERAVRDAVRTACAPPEDTGFVLPPLTPECSR